MPLARRSAPQGAVLGGFEDELTRLRHIHSGGSPDLCLLRLNFELCFAGNAEAQ